MTTRHLLDSELHPLIDMMPDFHVNADTLLALREREAVMGDPAAAGVTRTEIMVPNGAGPDVRCLLYIPDDASSPRPGYLHIHGGGYVMGTPEMSDVVNIRIASRLGAVVLSVDYRLPPEHPIPAPLDDCYVGLTWLHGQAGERGGRAVASGRRAVSKAGRPASDLAPKRALRQVRHWCPGACAHL